MNLKPNQTAYCVNNKGVEDFIKEWDLYRIYDVFVKDGVRYVEIVDNNNNVHYLKEDRFVDYHGC